MKGVRSHMHVRRCVLNGKTLKFNFLEDFGKSEHTPIVEEKTISLSNLCEDLQYTQCLQNYPGYLNEDILQKINEYDSWMSEIKNKQDMTFQKSQQDMQNSQYVETPVQNWQSQQDSVPTVPIEERRSVGLLLKDAHELNEREEQGKIDMLLEATKYYTNKAIDNHFNGNRCPSEDHTGIEISIDTFENNQENGNRNITIKLKNIEQEFIWHYALGFVGKLKVNSSRGKQNKIEKTES